jgi:hypothetical protein
MSEAQVPVWLDCDPGHDVRIKNGAYSLDLIQLLSSVAGLSDVYAYVFCFLSPLRLVIALSGY